MAGAITWARLRRPLPYRSWAYSRQAGWPGHDRRPVARVLRVPKCSAPAVHATHAARRRKLKHVLAGRSRRRTRAVDDHAVTIRPEADHHGRDAAHATHGWLGDPDRKRGRHGGIDGVTARAQDFDPGRGGERMHSRHHPVLGDGFAFFNNPLALCSVHGGPGQGYLNAARCYAPTRPFEKTRRRNAVCGLWRRGDRQWHRRTSSPHRARRAAGWTARPRRQHPPARSAAHHGRADVHAASAGRQPRPGHRLYRRRRGTAVRQIAGYGSGAGRLSAPRAGILRRCPSCAARTASPTSPRPCATSGASTGS